MDAHRQNRTNLLRPYSPHFLIKRYEQSREAFVPEKILFRGTVLELHRALQRGAVNCDTFACLRVFEKSRSLKQPTPGGSNFQIFSRRSEPLASAAIILELGLIKDFFFFGNISSP
jgi:hypothetical protein